MTSGHRSYLKTVVLAAGAGALIIGATLVAAAFETGIAKILVEAIGWPLGLLSECVAAGGLLVVYRSAHLDLGQPDLFLHLNAARSLEALTADGLDVGMWLRRLLRVGLRGSWLLVGDVVEVRSLEEIQRTLDDSGCLDGLPFMAEMAAFCGRTARVFRCVDKVYDYGRSKTLRRLRHVSLLAGLRCDGSAHGGCQASCYLMWNDRWLRRVDQPVTEARGPVSVLPTVRDVRAAHEGSGNGTPPTRYTCQYTQLAAASTPLSPWDIRQDVRPLLSGNVTILAFTVAILTRLFNSVQAARGGSGFPAMPQGKLTKTPLVVRGLVPGSQVRVLDRERLAATLDVSGRTRGLWFDLDMIKHCGGRYTVAKRVERIIDDATGQMLEMKNACIVLNGADASGEFLHFCPQHEHIFWREGWLDPEASGQRNGSVPG